ncbi:nucleoside-diphosphate kinase [Streptococcus caballi]|uniref:nucleoside-diphosphate kinase n=1 Tax=Streptococcus caballi TaxID=439220 RepID=UPI000364AEB5|nr:nucleoside-diphosphate kinase [Streptococcus caballi]
MEKTFFIIKPDGVQRGLVGEVLHRIEVRGFKLEALDMRMVTPELLSQHYEALVDRPFFPKIVDYMTSGPVIIGVFSGNEAIASWRKMMGATNPLEALPGTIRGDFAQAPSENGATFNIVHGSDSKESAQREMLLWFGKEV